MQIQLVGDVVVVLETSVGESEHENACRGGLKPRPSPTGCSRTGTFQKSRVAWECCTKIGDKSHLRLNTSRRPIANKYREGKLQSTLKRG